MKTASELTNKDLGAFHDAELCQVSMNRTSKTLSLLFELDNGTRMAIHFKGIQEFKISEIYIQNVVSRLRLSSLGSMSDADIGWILAWMLDRDEKGRANLIAKVSKDRVADIKNGKYLLLYLEPSVGAEVAVIAEELTIAPYN